MTAVQSLRSKALLSQIQGDRCAVSLLVVSQHPHLPSLFQFTVSIGTAASGQGKRVCSSAPCTPLLTVSKESPGCLGSVLTPTQQYWELSAPPASPCLCWACLEAVSFGRAPPAPGMPLLRSQGPAAVVWREAGLLGWDLDCLPRAHSQLCAFYILLQNSIKLNWLSSGRI